MLLDIIMISNRNLENNTSFYNIIDVLNIQCQGTNIGVKRRFFTMIIDRFNKLQQILNFLKIHHKEISIINNLITSFCDITNLTQSLFINQIRNPNISLDKVSIKDIHYIYQTAGPSINNSISLLSSNKLIDFSLKTNQQRNELIYYSNETKTKILNYTVDSLLKTISLNNTITISRKNTLIQINFNFGWINLSLLPYDKNNLFWAIYDFDIINFKFNENSKREFYLFINNYIYKLIEKYSTELVINKYNISNLFIGLIFKGIIIQIFKQISLKNNNTFKIKLCGDEIEGYFEVFLLGITLENSLKGKIYLNEMFKNINIRDNNLNVLIEYQSNEWRLLPNGIVSKMYSESIVLDFEKYQNLQIQLLIKREPTLLMSTINKLKIEFGEVFKCLEIKKLNNERLLKTFNNCFSESGLCIYFNVDELEAIILVKLNRIKNIISNKLKLKYKMTNGNNDNKIKFVLQINDILNKI